MTVNRIRLAIQYARHVADPRVRYARWMDTEPDPAVELVHSVCLAATVLHASSEKK